MEILSPAGSMESLYSALRAGADAVYLGYSAFSARSGAGNFDDRQLREACDLMHLHGKRVYVAVNTLVRDEEMEDVERVLRLLCDCHADAVLVQDLGVLDMLRRQFPFLTVHASTQMAIHNASGIRFLKRMGVSRAVLARECSAEEVAGCAGEGLEIEIFCHGAQCVSVSGECLLSGQFGSRSGNRGRCAQPCRLMYTYRGRTGAWLSPRDVCLRDELDRLQETGAVSLKIEGRLKRPEYVETVTKSYRAGLDSLEPGPFRRAGKDEREGLLQIFNRDGFMKGYLLGDEDRDVVSLGEVRHTGLSLGEVTLVRRGMAVLNLERDLADQDQLRFPGGEMIYAGNGGKRGDRVTVRLRPGLEVQAGEKVYRLVSQKQLDACGGGLPEIPVDMHLRALPGEAMILTAKSGAFEVCLTGDVVQAARSRAVTGDEMERNLRKCGDSPFRAEQVTVETREAFVPLSRLNALRRETLEALSRQIIRGREPGCGEVRPSEPVRLPDRPCPPLAVVRRPEQIRCGEGVRFALEPEDWRMDVLEVTLAGMPRGTWLQLPVVTEEKTLEQIRDLTSRFRDLLGGVVLGSVGQLGMEWPVPFGCGISVPVMNRRAADFLFRKGSEFCVASPELSGEAWRILADGCPSLLVPALGRQTVMLLHHCPARVRLGLKEGHGACRLCDTDHPDALRGTCLEDRFRHSFPLLRVRLPEGCQVRMLQDTPVNVLHRVREMHLNWMAQVTVEESLEALMRMSGQEGHFRESVE